MKYPYELKKQVVELFFEGESVPELTKRFSIKSRRRIYDWVAIVREHWNTAYQKQRMKRIERQAI